jgi:TetR/AcrR family transcriptional regulator, transcriptional repressor of bet genes
MPRIGAETREARRQAFVDAAWRCAATRGYRNWTVDDVCTEAGGSKGAFYGYFEGKGDLLMALLEDDAEWIDRLIGDLDARDLSAPERLRWFIQRTLQRREEPGRIQVRADLWAEMLTDETIRRPFVARIRGRRDRIRAWLESGLPNAEEARASARALASIALALVDGLTLHRAVDPTAFQWRNVRRAVDVLLAGLDPD